MSENFLVLYLRPVDPPKSPLKRGTLTGASQMCKFIFLWCGHLARCFSIREQDAPTTNLFWQNWDAPTLTLVPPFLRGARGDQAQYLILLRHPLRTAMRGRGDEGVWGVWGVFFPMPNAQCPMPNAPCPMPNYKLPFPNQGKSRPIAGGRKLFLGL
ncbi:multi-sensor hybrid histidine kinase [Calothrix sp. NIES-2100]|nr:multi-sensor hybrid histidine kinase [Calothrix sp. NIES-2100]